MVDPDRARARLGRLEDLLRSLDGIRALGKDAYMRDVDVRDLTERRLQVAIQICIDLGAQLLSESGGSGARDYADVFRELGKRHAELPDDLIERLVQAAGLRNLLVHDYMEIDDARVFATLAHTDDLRSFAVFVASRVA